jgi:hypothetical protein
MNRREPYSGHYRTNENENQFKEFPGAARRKSQLKERPAIEQPSCNLNQIKGVQNANSTQ